MTTTINPFDIATAQATALMFRTLGKYTGKLPELMDRIKTIYDMDVTPERCAAFDEFALDWGNYGHDDSVHLASRFTNTMIFEAPKVFNELRDQLLTSLMASFDAVPAVEHESQPSDLLYSGPMQDWRLDEQQALPDDRRDEIEVPAAHQTQFQVNIHQGGPSQFRVQIAEPHENPDELDGKLQLCVAVEVDNGRPSVGIYNDLYGNQLLKVYSTPDGLMLSPGASDLFITSRVPLEGSALAELDDELNPPGQRRMVEDAFLATRAKVAA